METSKKSSRRKERKGFLAPVKKNGWAGSRFLLPFTAEILPVIPDSSGRPQPSGRKAVKMLTLQELKQIVNVPTDGEKIPTAKQLRESGVTVAKKRIGQDLEAVVYQSGYVLYREGRHSTVFPLHSCRDYLYLSSENVVHLPEQFFDDREWYLRLVLEGEDRLNRNHEEKERSWNVSYSAISEEWAVIEDQGKSMMEHLVRQETVEELLQVLNERQKCIVWKYYLQEETQKQISRELGISQQTVSAILLRAVKNIREKYLTFQEFSENRSCCAKERV